MSSDEQRQLVNEYNRLVNEYNALVRENARLQDELDVSIHNVGILSDNATAVGNSVHKRVAALQKYVSNTEMNTEEVLTAINELSKEYFTFKILSEAAKELTKYTDEFNTKYKYYHNLRRITLGYVIAMDSNIISDEVSRKRVEKAYLENSEYWLAYCIMAVMLWNSHEKEAAERAVEKALKIDYRSANLFFMLINIRFGRLETARRWYVNYLDHTDMKNPGKEWRYMLQAYLVGAFGYDETFSKLVQENFDKMLAQAETVSADLGAHFVNESREFAETFLHNTEKQFPVLKRLSAEGEGMVKLLSEAEKNQILVDYYNDLLEREKFDPSDINQRIEDVLYSLINAYEKKEGELIRKIQLNEAIMQADGDIAAANRKIDEMYEDEDKNLTFPELLFEWAFSENPLQTDEKVRRFSIHYMKKWIKKGIAEFANEYRKKEPREITVHIDGCTMKCDLDSHDRNHRELSGYYDKNRRKDVMSDNQVLISGTVCFAAILTIAITIGIFATSGIFSTGNAVALVSGILAGIAGGIFLWFRVKDLAKILDEKKRLGLKKLQQVLDEFEDWKKRYDEADAVNDDTQAVFDQF